MTLAMFRAMLLSLFNDKGALAMNFLLPVVFFLVMAEIFSGASGLEMQLRVVIADEVKDDVSGRLVAALRGSDAINVAEQQDLTRQQVIELVRKGTADIGLIVRADARKIEDMSGFGEPPLLLVSDPAKGVAVPMLSGQIQKAYFEGLPDIALGSVVAVITDQYVEFDADQDADMQSGLAELKDEAEQGRPAGWSFTDMLAQKDVVGQSSATNFVAYYAGAVAFLFLLFACMQGAISLAEERESGVLERIMAGPGGIRVMVNGKFLFLVLQGLVQMLIIFGTAWLVYGVDLPGNFGPWLVITVLACMAAAGLSLTVASACRTRMQMQNISIIFVLIVSAVGGSMVPRFFMPDWLRDLGWFTPNTWVLEAYSGVFWRGESLLGVALPCGLLLVTGLVGLLAARWLAESRARL
jgi:ABC-2 type transport system permease protein